MGEFQIFSIRFSKQTPKIKHLFMRVSFNYGVIGTHSTVGEHV